MSDMESASAKLAVHSADRGPGPTPGTLVDEDKRKWLRLYLRVDGDPTAQVAICFSPQARELLRKSDSNDVARQLMFATSRAVKEFWDKM